MSAEFGGMKIPSSRKDFMFDMRSMEEADGERRMMGWSMRRVGFFWRFETSGAWGAGLGSDGRERRNVAAVLR